MFGDPISNPKKWTRVTLGDVIHKASDGPHVSPEYSESGIPFIELVNMEELSADSVYEFAFVGACLKIRGATGSPMRPLAIPLRPEHGGQIDDE